MRTGRRMYWIPSLQRFMTISEKMAFMGFPSHQKLAHASRSPCSVMLSWDEEGMIGNAMHLANIGVWQAVVLACIQLVKWVCLRFIIAWMLSCVCLSAHADTLEAVLAELSKYYNIVHVQGVMGIEWLFRSLFVYLHAKSYLKDDWPVVHMEKQCLLAKSITHVCILQFIQKHVCNQSQHLSIVHVHACMREVYIRRMIIVYI